MSDYDNTNRGAMFPNKYKEDGDKKPDHTGNVNVEGKEFKIAAWQSTSKAGNAYLSVKITEPEVSGSEGNNDEVPF
jgi:uncharacterized protein (DUF736 family)|tara:strand:- start:9463 stop:9690 length:228 start_codon:yes stop_codon:yes gene_type:complete